MAHADRVLYDPDNTGERILFFGFAGVGKTEAIFTMLQYLGEDVTVHYIDNDDTYAKSYKLWVRRRGKPEFRCNVVVHKLDNGDFKGHVDLLNELRGNVNPQDWVVVDMLTPLWAAAQDHFTNGVFGSNVEDYFFQVRIAKGEKGMTINEFLDGSTDWGTINKLYAAGVSNNLINMGCNVAATAEVAKVGKEGAEDRDNFKLFGPLGLKPAGQKRIPHIFHSIILLHVTRDRDYLATTLKDRGNELLVDEPWEDWGIEWLRDQMMWDEKMVEKKVTAKKKVKEVEDGSETGDV